MEKKHGVVCRKYNLLRNNKISKVFTILLDLFLLIQSIIYSEEDIHTTHVHLFTNCKINWNICRLVTFINETNFVGNNLKIETTLKMALSFKNTNIFMVIPATKLLKWCSLWILWLSKSILSIKLFTLKSMNSLQKLKNYSKTFVLE